MRGAGCRTRTRAACLQDRCSNRTRDRHVISVPHLPSVLSAQKYPWRESNSHFQLRKLALYPLSYRGLCAPLAGLEPATSGPGNRHTIHCATRALGRKDSHLRRQLWRPPLNQLSYIRIEPVASLELATFSLDDCRATSYTSPPS